MASEHRHDNVRETVLKAIMVGDAGVCGTDPNRLVIYHIGGEGGQGPVTSVINEFGRDCLLVVFDARPDVSDFTTTETTLPSGARKLSINIGVEGHTGRSPFHINAYPLSSSVRPPSTNALREHCLFTALTPPYEPITTWEQNTEQSSSIEIDVITIDDLVDSGAVPPPDIISLDAQGSDYDILFGASRTLSETVLCTITEAMLFEFYKGEKLFGDIFNHMVDKGFRFIDFLTRIYTHPSTATGAGALTMVEALFLRQIPPAIEPPFTESTRAQQYIKLARVAYALNRKSYANNAMDYVKLQYPDQFALMTNESEYSEMFKHYTYIQKNEHKYLDDNFVFLRSEYRELQRSFVYKTVRALWRLIPSRVRYLIRHRTFKEPAPWGSPLAFHEDPPGKI